MRGRYTSGRDTGLRSWESLWPGTMRPVDLWEGDAMKRGLRAVRVTALAALFGVLWSLPVGAAEVDERLAQAVGEGDIAICHALQLEVTPYELLLVPNDGDYGGHLAEADQPVDPANLIWPDIIPAPQNGSGESYCPDTPPSSPNPDPPTDPTPDAPSATVPPQVNEPPVATQPATVAPTDPPSDVPAEVQADDPATSDHAETQELTVAATETPAQVTALPVTGSGSSALANGLAWLPAGAILLMLLGAVPIALRRWRR